MKIRVTLVEPEYEMNIGYICRTMANFDVRKLYIINPKCEIGEIALKYAKHGKDILKKLKITCWEEATKDCFILGTTAIEKRYKKTIRSVTGLKDFLKNNKINKEIALIIGREGIGLKKEEIEKCDALVKIETSKKYPTLNISHALAILLYELKNKRINKNIELASIKEKDAFINFFKNCVKGEKGVLAMKRIIYRTKISKVEIKMLLKNIKKIYK